ncbi:MAG: pyrimidine-nucleoside phosphorylase [Pirellulaceae bacterium]|jgi:pyrimidine-nucleoside phosphorylase
MNVSQIIAAKRDGHKLTDEDIAYVVAGYSCGDIRDYQMSAFAMAVFCRGMDSDETTSLTKHMLMSGVKMNWNDDCQVVDKHSTGGIGDKTSLILAPLLACFELKVPMISGRGLGPTGGTLDKLEAIPGFRTNLSTLELIETTNRVGCVISGATAEIAPADRKLYALRDVTGTVPSIPLITASIMSKKLAENLDCLVLDVKCGNGAFMKTRQDATALARSLVNVGQQMGVATIALITDMNQPLGKMIGNAIEVIESMDALENRGPKDLAQVTTALAAELLVMTNIATDLSAAHEMISEKLRSGEALDKFREMVSAQGGDLTKPLLTGTSHEVMAIDTGVIGTIDTEALGLAIIEMKGGRKFVGQHIDHSVGIKLNARLGDEIDAGDSLATIYVDSTPEQHIATVREAIQISDLRPPDNPLIIDRIG